MAHCHLSRSVYVYEHHRHYIQDDEDDVKIFHLVILECTTLDVYRQTCTHIIGIDTRERMREGDGERQ